MRIELITSNQRLIQQVVELGTKNSKTLGHFPEGAFKEHALRGNLICAHKDGDLLGYLLFSVTKSKLFIRVVHLCISKDNRDKGVARSLMDFVKNKYSLSLKGIALNCREDYTEATKFWQKYGFVARNKVRSRSKQEKYLIKWWYDFGNLDLFSSSNLTSSKIRALFDANIIIKIRDGSKTDLSGTRYLLEDWLVDEVDYYFAPEIFNEFLRDENSARAAKSRAFISRFKEARFKPDRKNQVLGQLNELYPSKLTNDVSDKKQLADCIASEMDYFITTDEKILNLNNEILDKYNVEIMKPVDFILSLDENRNYSNYLSSRIAGVNYDYSPLKAGEINSLVGTFLDRRKNEREHELRDTLIGIVSNTNEGFVKVVRDGKGEKLGFWSCLISDDSLKIPIIRVNNTRLCHTLFRQLLVEILRYAKKHDFQIVSILDHNIEESFFETLEALGFVFKKNQWVKVALHGVMESSEAFKKDIVSSMFKGRVSQINALNLDSDFLYEMERKFWPVKFKDLNIPTYIIPIKPDWARELFDNHMANSTLFGASAKLAWSRENVYYRSAKPVSEKSPARLLWYCSEKKNITRSKAVVACSYIDEVHVGEAKKLFQRFRHFGVYEWDNVYKQAGQDSNGIIKAIKFSDTEVFQTPIPFTKVNEVLKNNSRNENTFTSPLEVDNKIFLELYKLGEKK